MELLKLEQMIREANMSIHLECEHNDAVTLFRSLKQFQGMVLVSDDELYPFMKVREALLFYRDLTGSTYDVYDAMELFELSRYATEKIASLDPSIYRRVLIARSLMMNPKLLVIENPIANIDKVSAQIIVSAMERLSEIISIFTISSSFRDVCLMPGNLYHYRNDALVPIYESVKHSLKEGVYQNHGDGDSTLIIKSNNSEYLIDYRDIFYVESIESVSHIYVKNSLIPTQYTLAELEEILLERGFFRCHRSYLVNVATVNEIQQWTRNSYVLVLNGPEDLEIPLSKRRYAEFKAMLRSEG